MPNQGFSLPRNFKGSAEIRPNLERNFKQLTSFLNTYVPTYNNDDTSLYLRGGAKAGVGYSPSDSEDLVPLSHLTSTLGSYLPLSAGSSKSLTGALYTSSSIVMTATSTNQGIMMDTDGFKRITWNDGHGHFNISLNADPTGTMSYINTGDGASRIELNGESVDGRVDLFAAEVGTAGNTITFARRLALTPGGLFVSRRNNENSTVIVAPENVILASGEVEVTSPTVGTTLAPIADVVASLPYTSCPIRVMAWGLVRANVLDADEALVARITIGGSSGTQAIVDMGDIQSAGSHQHQVDENNWGTTVVDGHQHATPVGVNKLVNSNGAHTHEHDNVRIAVYPIEFRAFTPSLASVTIELEASISTGGTVDFCKFIYLVIHGAD